MEMGYKGKDPTAYLLCGAYKSVKVGCERLVCILPKVQDKMLIREMTGILESYFAYSGRLEDMMRERGIEPVPPGVLSKIGARAGMGINTVIDATPKNIARLYKLYANSASHRLSRLRDEVACQCEAKALGICDEIIEKERASAEGMEEYL